MSLLGQGVAPYLQRVQLLPERITTPDVFPFNLPVIQSLDTRFRTSVTFIVGENGSGKSTIVEGLAGLLSLPLAGGGTVDTAQSHGPQADHDLASALRPSFRRRPHDAYFFRGEFAAHFAQLLDERAADPWFRQSGDPYALYGRESLFKKSHGEGYLAVLRNRIGTGFYLLDEPEAALSPSRQLMLIEFIAQRASEGAQFIIATHSPILMSIPHADILLIENGALARVRLEETEHYNITRELLLDPSGFWRERPPL